ARGDAFHEERAEIAVERADPVFFAESVAGADDDCFLSDAGVDAASDFALLDQDAEPLVERANELQPVEHLEQLLGGELEFRSLDRRHSAGQLTTRPQRDTKGTEAGAAS